RHSYQWDFVSAGGSAFQITYPEGAQYMFTYTGGNWVGESTWPDKLTQSGTTFYLRRTDGFEYRFDQHSYGGGTVYRLTSFKDTVGNTYSCAYDNDKRLTRVTEPAGRYLEISYTTVQSNNNAFSTIASIGSSAPADAWNEINVTDTN